MRTAIAFAPVTLLLLVANARAEDNCIGLARALSQADKSVLSNIAASVKSLLSSATPTQDDCGSLATVFDRISNRKRIGGRRLEEDKPLDPTAAQADLDKALHNDEVRARIEKARAGTTDTNAALIYEAAILDSEGYYAARDLIVSQVVQKSQ